MEEFTLGVEEEYQIVDMQTRALRAREREVLAQAQPTLGESVQPEFHASQIEIATPVCKTLAEARAQLIQARRALREAAAKTGCTIAASGTHPFSQTDAQPITPKPRYEDMAQDYQALARELVIFGCHVHVSLTDPDLAISVLNRARVWLTPLLALSASSPFWQGADTGYASFRTEMWVRWPMAGPPLLFADRAEHDALVQTLVQSGSISDETKIYWDVRLPAHVPTIEFRVADVCHRIDEAVMIAGLVRGLVQTCYAQTVSDMPFPAARPELLRAAHWRAARYGLDGELIDIGAARSVPASDLIRSLLDFIRPALEESGDWEEVTALVAETLQQGNGAMRQRAVYQKSGRLEDVVDYIIAETARGTE